MRRFRSATSLSRPLQRKQSVLDSLLSRDVTIIMVSASVFGRPCHIDGE